MTARIAAFAGDCVGHENGYQTVKQSTARRPHDARSAAPNPDTEQDKQQLNLSMMTCEQQVSSKTFAFTKHFRPRRALVIDQQKGLVAMYPLFINDGTRRGAKPGDPPGMLQNLVTVETFGIRSGLIHEAEVFLHNHPLRLGERLDAGLGTVKRDQGSGIRCQLSGSARLGA